MQLRHWKIQWIPLQIYVLIVGLKVKELLTVFLRTDIRLHQESTEKEWNTSDGIIQSESEELQKIIKRIDNKSIRIEIFM